MRDTPLSLVWDWTRLRLLVEIERHGSISAAARELGIGQPTASAHLRTLETSAGHALVERSGRGSVLTEAGRALANHAAQAIATLKAGEEELQALAGLEGGTIHLGASSTPGIYLLPDALGRFRRDHPNVTIEVEIASTGEILDRLLTGGLQLALVGEARADDRIQLEPFLEDEIVGVAAPDLVSIGGGVASATALRPHTLLVRERGSATRRIAEQALAGTGARPAQVWELDSTEAIKRATRAGLGYSFVSRYAVLEELARGDLVAFRLDRGPRMTRSLYIARLARRPLAPSEKRFLETLTDSSRASAEDAVARLA